MNSGSIAAQLGELIDADEQECACLEQMIRMYGLIGFFQQLNDTLPFSAECLEKLYAVQLIISQTVPVSLNGGKQDGNPPYA